MVSITFPINDKLFSLIEMFPWVNWSELARERLMKREIFEEYLKTGKLSDKDRKFCDKIDWHPVDELELKEEFIERLNKISKEPSKGKAMSPEELKKRLKEL